MRKVIISLLTGSSLLGACAGAQENGSGMEIQSPAGTIATCYADHRQQADRERHCIGQYTQACMRLRPGGETTVGMITCIGEEYEVWDARLNDVYRALRPNLSEAASAALREAQLAWIASRDADCALDALQFEGGTMGRVIAADCMMTLTARRTLQLEHWQIVFQQP